MNACVPLWIGRSLLICHFTCIVLHKSGAMQGVGDEKTPPRDLGDTYSVSTDPSSDEGNTKGLDIHQADSIVADATSSQSEEARHKSREQSEPPRSHPSSAHERHTTASGTAGTQEAQHDPAEDAAMQEGELTIGNELLWLHIDNMHVASDACIPTCSSNACRYSACLQILWSCCVVLLDTSERRRRSCGSCQVLCHFGVLSKVLD